MSKWKKIANVVVLIICAALVHVGARELDPVALICFFCFLSFVMTALVCAVNGRAVLEDENGDTKLGFCVIAFGVIPLVVSGFLGWVLSIDLILFPLFPIAVFLTSSLFHMIDVKEYIENTSPFCPPTRWSLIVAIDLSTSVVVFLTIVFGPFVAMFWVVMIVLAIFIDIGREGEGKGAVFDF